jgi:glycosyltransferase involved in cell wall biosynthesis
MMLSESQPSRPVRILLLESGTGPGGSVNFLRDFLPHVDHSKAHVIVGLYFPNPSKTLEEIQRLGNPVIFFKQTRPVAPKNSTGFSALFDTSLKRLRKIRTVATALARLFRVQLPLTWKVWRFINREAIDLVVLNQDVHFHVPGVLAAKLAGRPCICRKAGGIGEARQLKRFLNPWVDLFVSISKATETDQRNTPGTRKVFNIYEGLDLQRFASLPPKETMRESLGIPAHKKVVAAITRVEVGKGLPEFIHMAATVVRRYPDVVFLLVGDEGLGCGTLTGELRNLVQLLGLHEHVIFTGWREDIPAIMSCVDIFVHCPTTFMEGLARTCLETMAVGIPAVVSDNGGMPDAVVNGVTGFVVSPGDIKAMAKSVLMLLDNEARCREFGERARLRVQQLFDAAQNSYQLQEQILKCARPPKMPDLRGAHVPVSRKSRVSDHA